jgi:hypothetical protein
MSRNPGKCKDLKKEIKGMTTAQALDKADDLQNKGGLQHLA